MSGIFPYILIILMLMLSAFFSGSEIAFNASNKLRLKKAAEEGSKTAALAYKISEKFRMRMVLKCRNSLRLRELLKRLLLRFGAERAVSLSIDIGPLSV